MALNQQIIVIMIVKPISYLIIVCLLLSVPVKLTAQNDESDYVMFESMLLTPDYKNLKTLGEKMRAHNSKYHKDGAYKASVYNISTGPNSGKMVWMMGPLKYTHLDSRPADDSHDQDWLNNVMPYIKEIHTTEYWRMDSKLSNMSMMDGDNSKYPIIFVRYNEINEEHMHSIDTFYEMISKTIKAMDGDNPWGLYWNEFLQGELGRHVASVSFLKNWAEFDDERNDFKENFEKEVGKDKWQNFMDMRKKIFKNTWDEIWSYNAYMSGK